MEFTPAQKNITKENSTVSVIAEKANYVQLSSLKYDFSSKLLQIRVAGKRIEGNVLRKSTMIAPDQSDEIQKMILSGQIGRGTDNHVYWFDLGGQFSEYITVTIENAAEEITVTALHKKVVFQSPLQYLP